MCDQQASAAIIPGSRIYRLLYSVRRLTTYLLPNRGGYTVYGRSKGRGMGNCPECGTGLTVCPCLSPGYWLFYSTSSLRSRTCELIKNPQESPDDERSSRLIRKKNRKSRRATKSPTGLTHFAAISPPWFASGLSGCFCIHLVE